MRLFRFLIVVALLGLPVAARAAEAFAFSPRFRNASQFVTLGTSSAGCAANGTTASSASLTAGKYLMTVNSETVGICDSQDASCAAGPLAWVPGTQIIILVTATTAGSWHCRSAGATGYVTYFPLD